MTTFELHPTLAADTAEVTRWPLSHVLLSRDARYPWLLLVPARADMRDMHDLDPTDQATLMTEIDRASRALVSLYDPDKINVGALGNMVPQLHIHVVARFRTDDAWPGPIWGAHPPRSYGAEALEDTLRNLRDALD